MSAIINSSGLSIAALGQLKNQINMSQAYNSTFNFSSDTINTINGDVKKYEIYEISQDLLALSTTWQRIRESRNSSPVFVDVYPEKILDAVLFKNVTGDDIAKANEIRDYYSKKIMLWKLKGQELTRFRKDMNEFVHSDGKKFREEMKPLVYCLPDFYDQDVAFDALAMNHNTKVVESQSTIKKLKLVKTFTKKVRGTKRKEYWFIDKNDNLVTTQFQADNPLISLMDLVTKNEIEVSGSFRVRSRDDKEYITAPRLTFF